ncbi:hypothetical protein B0T49_21380 [Chromobacterium violaceum]|uniref:hypothetical protein n=1 Tax=Chromobacterium violaceum TaxID=536 RepID=UPI0009DA0E2A|nr:hypothetical protein [Chromobacterium violaceum]OQS45548.1 hypothetical protein B0T49_21380 [Chromobacterium violaceum]OQS47824.1 hypothetical protein B0T48_12130 [Chromobacterium violaceum]
MTKNTYNIELTLKCRLVEDAEVIQELAEAIAEADKAGNKAAMGIMAGAMDDLNKVPEIVIKASLREQLKVVLSRVGFDRIEVSGKVTPKKDNFALIEAAEKTYL